MANMNNETPEQRRRNFEAAFPTVQSASGKGVALPMTTLSPEARAELREARTTFRDMEGNSQPQLGQDAPTAIMVDGAQDLIEGPNRVSSQAGLAAYSGGEARSLPSVPAPGQPGSRFNPRVVSREEQAARREVAAGVENTGRGTKSLGVPGVEKEMITMPPEIKNPPAKAAEKGVAKGAPEQQQEPSVSVMEQMMADVKHGDGKSVSSAVSKGLGQGLSQGIAQRMSQPRDKESIEAPEVAEIAPKAIGPSAVVNHLGQSRDELTPAATQGPASNKVVMDPAHVAALETMDQRQALELEEAGRQESSGGGYQR